MNVAFHFEKLNFKMTLKVTARRDEAFRCIVVDNIQWNSESNNSAFSQRIAMLEVQNKRCCASCALDVSCVSEPAL